MNVNPVVLYSIVLLVTFAILAWEYPRLSGKK